MSKNSDLITAYSELGDAAANLTFVGLERLAKRARDLQSEVEEFVDWLGGEE